MIVTRDGFENTKVAKSGSPQVDENGNPIFHGDGSGINWEKVTPAE